MTEEKKLDPTPEEIQDALDAMSKYDTVRTVKGCAYGCIVWSMILVGIIDIFFVNIALGLLLYGNNAL